MQVEFGTPCAVRTILQNFLPKLNADGGDPAIVVYLDCVINLLKSII